MYIQSFLSFVYCQILVRVWVHVISRQAQLGLLVYFQFSCCSNIPCLVDDKVILWLLQLTSLVKHLGSYHIFVTERKKNWDEMEKVYCNKMSNFFFNVHLVNFPSGEWMKTSYVLLRHEHGLYSVSAKSTFCPCFKWRKLSKPWKHKKRRLGCFISTWAAQTSEGRNNQ